MRTAQLVILVMTVVVLVPLSNAAGSQYYIKQLTDNDADDQYPVISGTNVAWNGNIDFEHLEDESDIVIYNPTLFGSVPKVLATGNALVGLSESWATWTMGLNQDNPQQIDQGHEYVFANNNPFAPGAAKVTAYPSDPWEYKYMPKIWGQKIVYATHPDLNNSLPFYSDQRSDFDLYVWDISKPHQPDHATDPNPLKLAENNVRTGWSPKGRVGHDISGKLPGDSYTMNTTSHVVYRTEGPMGDEVWAFDLYEQEYTRLSDPNYHWNVRSVDIEGNQVVWSASYSDNGPEYEDWEIYTYHLLEGPTSYEQVTQNSVSDIDARTNGESAAWLTGVFEDGFLTTDQLITNEGGVHNVIAESNYFREFVYDDVIAWTIHYSEAAGGALRIRDGNDEYQFSEHAGAYYLQVDGKNLAWMESDVPPGDPDGDFEIFAAYYIGRSAILTGLDLSLMDLSGEPLFGADLRYTDLRSALIEGTDFRGADFTGATNLEYAIGQAIFSHQTILPEYFNAHDAGWSYVTPEPTALLLALVGLALLPRRRRRIGV